jgi:hypothetical protein
MIAFQVSLFILFSTLPPPFNIGSLVVFWAFKFYRSAALIAAVGFTNLLLYRPDLIYLLHNTVKMSYFNPRHFLLDYIDPLTYCYARPMIVSWELYQVIIYGFFIIFTFISIRLEVRLVRKYLVKRVMPFLT